MIITSHANPRLRRARRLLQRRARVVSGLFLADGEDLLHAALAGGINPVEVFAAADTPLPEPISDRVVRVSDALLRDLSTLEHPARVVSVFRHADLPVAEPATVAIGLFAVRDPGNVGTLIRSMALLGPGIVGVGAGTADPTSPRAVRASMGGVFAVALASTDELAGMRVALDPDATTRLDDIDLTGPVVLLVGAERDGLPAAERRRADATARIPTSGVVGSLNAAMAGTIALYETRRQRR